MYPKQRERETGINTPLTLKWLFPLLYTEVWLTASRFHYFKELASKCKKVITTFYFIEILKTSHVKQQPAVVHFSLGGGGRVHSRQVWYFTHTHTHTKNTPIFILLLSMIGSERERDEWRHVGPHHTSHTALGLTGTLRTWHSFQVGTKWRWHRAVSALQLIRRRCHSGSECSWKSQPITSRLNSEIGSAG